MLNHSIVKKYLDIYPESQIQNIYETLDNTSKDFINYLMENIENEKYKKMAIYWMSENDVQENNNYFLARPLCFMFEQFNIPYDEPINMEKLKNDFLEWIKNKYEIDVGLSLGCNFGSNIFNRNIEESKIILNHFYEFLIEEKKYEPNITFNDYSMTIWYEENNFNIDGLFNK